MRSPVILSSLVHRAVSRGSDKVLWSEMVLLLSSATLSLTFSSTRDLTFSLTSSSSGSPSSVLPVVEEALVVPGLDVGGVEDVG